MLRRPALRVCSFQADCIGGARRSRRDSDPRAPNQGEAMTTRSGLLACLRSAPPCLRFRPRARRRSTIRTKPVHFIVCFAAGGPNDITARLFGQYLSENLGQQFIIENRVGAGGNIGTQAYLAAPPDGYTIGFVGPNNFISASLYAKPAVRFHPRQRAGRRHHEADQRAGGEPRRADQDRRRVHRLCQGQSGQDELRPRRRRHLAAYVGRTAQVDGRHQHRPRAVPRHRAGGHRSARRPAAIGVRQSSRLDRPHQGRQAARARRHRAQAHRGAARRAGDRRDRAGLRWRTSSMASRCRRARRRRSSPSSTARSTPC